MRPMATGAGFADIEVTTPAFGAECNPVDKTLFQIVPPGEKQQIAFLAVARLDVFVAVLSFWIGAGCDLSARFADPAQEVEAPLVRGGARSHGLCLGRHHRSVGCCAKAEVPSCQTLSN